MLGRESVVIGRLPPFVFEVSELSQAVADAFGFGGKFPGAAAFATRFREFLADAQSRGAKVLLVIDEAQGLGDELLRKVFDLSTIGTFEEHPFAILLAGQKELSAALAKDQHAGLRQRITTRCVARAAHGGRGRRVHPVPPAHGGIRGGDLHSGCRPADRVGVSGRSRADRRGL